MFLKLTLLVLLIALLLPLLLACNPVKQEEPPFELLEDSSEKEPYSLYRIVISASCSSEIFHAAQDLKERLAKQTGVACEIVYDSEKTTDASDVFEIILGNTNRPVSQKAMKEFRKNDYVCQIQDATLVLGGRSEQATLLALHRFYDELLAHATTSSILPDGAGFVHHAEYPIHPITVGGTSLALFRIVYAKDSSERVIGLTKTLQAKIAEEGYYSLDLQAENEFDGASKRIYLTLSEEETSGVAHIRFDEYGVVLSAKDLFGLSSATREFFRQMISSVEESGSFGMPNTLKSVNYRHDKLTVTSILIHPEKDPADEVARMGKLVKNDASDLVFSGNMSEIQRACFYDTIANQYQPSSGVEFLRTTVSFPLIQSFAPNANLYQIGSDTDGFLLLSTSKAPTEEILNTLRNRTLPLLIIIDSSSSSNPWSNDTFDRAIFVSAEQASFTIWGDPDCFLITEGISQNGYRTFTLERSSAIYF